ncbi:MAG: energy transducer TonB, partial [Roseococcus sp.]
APPPAAVIAPPPPEPPPAPEPVPDALPVAPAPVAAAAPPPPPPPPAPPREARRLAARPPDARIASAASGARPAATPVAAGAESAPAAPAGEPLSAALLPDSYRAALGARLRQALRYPPSARERDEEGDAILAFRVARDGSIRGAQILRSSGVAALDQEALALLARIAPAPPLPETWPAAEAAFVLPVRFRLR